MSYLKAEVSEKSQWHLSKHRYLELTHYCLQYKDWKKELNELDGFRSTESIGRGDANWSDSTGTLAARRAELSKRIEQVEVAARQADTALAIYILLSVTEELTFPQMQARFTVPCGKDMFYDRRRKFFWLLDKKRD